MLTKAELIAFEKDISDEFLAARIRAPIHLSGNNEDQLISIFQEVQAEDWVFSTHRSHYHALLRGVPPERVKAEIMAGHSMHLNFSDYKFFTSAIVGGFAPIALGVAMGIKRRGISECVWCFLGDMAGESGIYYECKKYALGFGLPIRFVVEDNGLSTNTPTRKVWGMDDEDQRQPLGNFYYYKYKRKFPHVGAGTWVTFG